MDGGSNLPPGNLFQALIDRFKDLEASHQKLKEQFQVVLRERSCNVIANEEEVTSDSDDVTSLPGWGDLPGSFFLGNPYRNVLECMGHAIHVSRTRSWEIIYWNRAAEKLYGYKDYEALGQRTIELLFDEESLHSALAVMQSLSTGRCWSGQLRLRKRSGQSFMALVTKSPIYEDGELTGIVTVSSDAAVFNNTNSRLMRTNRAHAYEQSKFSKINLRRVQRHAQPLITDVPHLASSVSNLASKVIPWKRWDVIGDTLRTRECEEVEVDLKADRPPKVPITKPAFSMSIGGSRTEAMTLEKEESVSRFTQSSKTKVKFFQKLRIGAISNLGKVVNENMHQNSSEDRKEAANVKYSPRVSMESTHISNLDTNNQENSSKGVPVCTCQGCCEVHRPDAQLPKSSLLSDGSKFVPNTKPVNSEDASPKQSGYLKIQSSGECFGGGLGSLSSKGDNASPMNSEIRWDDLQLREEIGQGAFAVVYRGLWKGSDVAVKVYSGNQYSEETLLDSKKEIDIMRRLRHPNVLLFMGAVLSEGRIAMVTEYMIRGSLFKTLHKRNQSLDIRRRLRMAIDVARGMNYLHCRNPPVVHRDLKSSNLLVNKSWNVKVGDLGLSKLKYATFLSAKSGRGTPQWMAPEVLRNELSTEKSDVFSFGVILWELVTESIPWSDLNPLQVVGIVGFMDRRLDLPDDIDPELSSIISECWQSNPEDRPSFEHIIHKMTHLVQAGARMTARTAPAP